MSQQPNESAAIAQAADAIAGDALRDLAGIAPVGAEPAGAPPQPQPQPQPQSQPPRPAQVGPTTSPWTTGTPSAPLPLESISARFLDPTVTAPQPPAAPEPADEPEPDPSQFVRADGTPDKAAHAYAKLRHDAKRFEREASEARAQLATLEQEKEALAQEKAMLADEKMKLEQERDQLSGDLGRVSLAESPAFRQKYEGKAGEIVGRLTRTLTKYAGMSPEEARKTALEWARTPAEDLQDHLDDLHPSVAGAVLNAATELAELDEQRSQELKEWRTTAAAMGVAEARQSVIRSAEDRRRIADSAIEAAIRVGSPVYTADGDEGKRRSAEIADAFRGFMQTATDEQMAHAAAEGYTAPLLYEAMDAQLARIRELESELQSYRHASRVPLFPSMAPTPAPVAPTGVRTPPSGATPLNIAEQLAGEAVRAYRQTLGPGNFGPTVPM